MRDLRRRAAVAWNGLADAAAGQAEALRGLRCGGAPRWRRGAHSGRQRGRATGHHGTSSRFATRLTPAWTRWADRLPLVGDGRVADLRHIVSRGDLLHLRGVFDGVVLGILVVGEQIVAGQVSTGAP